MYNSIKSLLGTKIWSNLYDGFTTSSKYKYENITPEKQTAYAGALNYMTKFDKSVAETQAKFKLDSNDKHFIKYLDNVKNGTIDASEGMKGYNKSLSSMTSLKSKATGTLSAIGSGLKEVGSFVGDTLKNMGANVLIFGGLQLAAQGIDSVVNRQEYAIERGNAALEKYEATQQEVAQTSKWVGENASRYEQLSKGVSTLGQNLNLTSTQYKEYQELSSQIAQQFPELVTGYDSLGQPVIGAARNVSDLNTALKNQKVLKYTEAVKDAKDIVDKFQAEVSDSKKWSWDESGTASQLDALKKLQSVYQKYGNKDKDETFAVFNMLTNNQDLVSALKAFEYEGTGLAGLVGEFSADDLREIAPELNKIIPGLEAQVENQTLSLKKAIPGFLQQSMDYQNLLEKSPQLDSQMTALINGMTFSDLEAKGFTGKNAVANMRKWANNAIDELQNSDIQSALDNVFTINDKKSEITFDEWRRQADNTLDAAAEKSDAFTREELRQGSGIKDSYEELKQAQDDIAARWTKNDGWDARKMLPIDQFRTLATIANDESFTGNFNEALAQIQTVQAIEGISLDELSQKVVSAKKNFAELQTAMTETNSATGVTADTVAALSSQFQGIDDVNKLFESTSSGLRINQKVLRAYTAEQEKLVKNDFAEAIAAQNAQIELQQEKLKNANTKAEKTAYQYDLDAMQNNLQGLIQQQAIYNGLISDRNKWLSESPEAGDNYDAVSAKFQNLKTLRKDDQGVQWTGTNEFRQGVDYFWSGSLDNASPKEIASIYDELIPRVQDWYQVTEKGTANNMASLEAFKADVKSLPDVLGKESPFSKLDQESKTMTLDANEFAEAWGVSAEVIQDMAGKFRDAGWNVKILGETTEESISTVQQAESKIKSITGDTYEWKFNTTSLDEAMQQVEKAKEQLDNFRNEDGTYNYDKPGAIEADHVFDDVVRHEQELGNSNIMAVDPSQVVSGYQDGIQAIQEYQIAKNELDSQTERLDAGISNNVTQATDNATKALENLKSEMGKGNVPFDIDTTGLQEAEDSIQSISDEEIKTKVGVDISDAEQSLSELSALEGSTVTITADVSNSEGVEHFVASVESVPEGVNTIINASVSGKSEIEAFETSLEKIPDNTPTVVNCTVNNADELSTLQSKVSELNQGNKQITLNAEVKPINSLNSEISAHPVDVTVRPSPKEIEVTAKDVSVNVSPEPKQLHVEADPTLVDMIPKEEPLHVEADSTLVDMIPKEDPLHVEAEPTTVSITPEPNPLTVEVNPATVDVNTPDKNIQTNGTVDFDLGDSPETVPDANGISNFDLGNSPDTVPDALGIANFVLGNVPTVLPPAVQYVYRIPLGGGGGGLVNGTAYYNGSARYTGSAYVKGSLGTLPFHVAKDMYWQSTGRPYAAGGNWALPHDETALVNELGQESRLRVRDGRWELIPGGAHFEQLKRGDIIFNTIQTRELMRNGYVTSGGGHGQVAHASGTALYSGKAYANGSWEDPWKNMMDWFERFVKNLEKRISIYEAKAENSSGLGTQNNYIQKAYESNQKLLQNYQKAQDEYRKQANSYAKEIGLSDSLKDKVENGSVNFEKLSDDDKAKVDAYAKWADKINECTEAIENLKKKQTELLNQKLDNVIKKYDILRGTYQGNIDVLESKNKFRDTAGYSIAPGSNTYKNIQQQKTWQDKQTKIYQSEISAAKKVLAQIAKEEPKGKKSNAYKEGVAKLKELEAALWDSKTAAEEYAKQLVEIKFEMDQWQIDKYDRAASKQSLYRDAKEALNYKDGRYGDISEYDYTEAIKTNDRMMVSISQKRADIQNRMVDLGSNSREYHELAEQLASLDEQILQLGIDNAELKASIVELRFQPFEDAQDTLANVISEYDTLRSMISSDTYLNNDASFSNQGMANIALIQESMEAERQKIANYAAHLNDIQAEYDNNNITKDQYEQMTKETMQNIRQSSKALYDYNEQMLDMYEMQIEKENELLQTNIDKRKDALSWKQKYYDYDKKIRKHSKDVNTLKAQIAALEGTTNAASKARLEKLKAELAEAEENMSDTVKQHEDELKKTGYDQLQDSANKALDNTLEALKKNTDMQKAVIDQMLNQVTASYDGAYSHIQQLIKDTGLMVSDAFKDYVNSVPDFNRDETGDYEGDKNATGGDHGHINAGDGVGDDKADQSLNGAVSDSDSSNDASQTIGKDNEGNKAEWAKAVTFPESSIVLIKGKSRKLTGTITPANATKKQLKATTNKANVATVSASGESITIRGQGVGYAVITVKTTYKYSTPATISVAVLEAAAVSGLDKYLKSTGKTISDSEKNSMLSFAAQSGQTSAKDIIANAKSSLLNKWYASLPNQKYSKKEIAGVSKLAGHFMEQGKRVNRNHLYDLARILGVNMSGHTAADYESWGSTLKNKILSEASKFGYRDGGLIDRGLQLPIWLRDINNGDNVVVGAKTGEYVMRQGVTHDLNTLVPETMNMAAAAIKRSEELNTGFLKHAISNINNARNTTNNENVYTNNIENMIRIDGNVDKYVYKDIKTLANDLGRFLKRDAKKMW